MARLRTAATDELTAAELVALRELFDAAFAVDPDGFGDEDWEHATGGLHVLLEEDGVILSTASVVRRELRTGEHRLTTGYVEAMATRPGQQCRGYGSRVMRAVGEHIDATYQLGALGTDLFAFYERAGWVRWIGPTFGRKGEELVRTAEEDGHVMVRRTPRTPPLDRTAPISCEWREGDVW